MSPLLAMGNLLLGPGYRDPDPPTIVTLMYWVELARVVLFACNVLGWLGSILLRGKVDDNWVGSCMGVACWSLVFAVVQIVVCALVQQWWARW